MKELTNYRNLSCFVVGDPKDNNNGLPMAVISCSFLNAET